VHTVSLFSLSIFSPSFHAPMLAPLVIFRHKTESFFAVELTLPGFKLLTVVRDFHPLLPTASLPFLERVAATWGLSLFARFSYWPEKYLCLPEQCRCLFLAAKPFLRFIFFFPAFPKDLCRPPTDLSKPPSPHFFPSQFFSLLEYMLKYSPPIPGPFLNPPFSS